MIGLYNSAQLGLRAISGFTVGVLGEFTGIHWSLGVSAAATLVLTIALWATLSAGARAPAALPAQGSPVPVRPTR